LIYLDLDRPHEAISLAERAILKKGNYQPAYLLKGLAYEALGQPGSAWKVYGDGLNLRQETEETDMTAAIVERVEALRETFRAGR
jgi:hypothetical protein